MASRPREYTPNILDAPNESEFPILDSPVLIESVSPQLRRFYTFSKQVNSSSEDPNSMERKREHTAAPPTAYSFVIHNCGRNQFERAQTSGTSASHSLQPSTCRKSFSMGHLCNKFGLTEIQSSSGRHISNTIKEARSNPPGIRSPTTVHGVQSFANPLYPAAESQNLPLASPMSHNTPDTERWRSARDMFTYPDVTRDGSQHISASKPNLKSIQRHHQETIPAVHTSKSRNQGRIDTQHHSSSNFRADSSWLRTKKERGENSAWSETSAPILKDHSHTNEEQSNQMQGQLTPANKMNPFLLNDKRKKEEAEKNRSVHPRNQVECDDPLCRATHTGHHPFRHSVSCSKHGSEQSRRVLDLSSASNKPVQIEAFEKLHSDTNLPPSQANDIHRHHSPGFHSYDHIAEHLSSAVGHSAYDLLKGRNEKKDQPTSSRASIKSRIKPSPYLEPLTQPKSVTQLDSFQWTQDTVPSGHPSRSSSKKQHRPPQTKDVTNASDHYSHTIASEKTTSDARNTISEEATIHGKQGEVHSVSNLSWRDNAPPSLRLASTPSWLRNPAKEAVDAIAPLHHVNTKNHEIHEHEHGYLSNIVVPPRTEDHVRSQSSYKAGSQDERHLLSKKLPRTSSLMPEVPKSVHATPKIQISQVFPEDGQRATPVPEAKDMHLHSDTRLGHGENSNPKPLHVPLRQQGSSKAFASTTNRADQEVEHGETKPWVEKSSELEIAKPTPIAPPNHECAWKGRYLALTAEIRQLKAEMSTRTSLRSSEIPTPGYEQHDDDIDLLGVTVNLHFRDRDDIVIGTDVSRDTLPA
ncbi:hypothetical protein F4825DRAFT_447988 [Nemania diffusa]|nr:hypothetical protein F4825DRAFT_447988 [Nemania diffusa]